MCPILLIASYCLGLLGAGDYISEDGTATGGALHSELALLPCFDMLCFFLCFFLLVSREEFPQGRRSMCFDCSIAHKGDLCRRVLTQVLVM